MLGRRRFVSEETQTFQHGRIYVDRNISRLDSQTRVISKDLRSLSRSTIEEQSTVCLKRLVILLVIIGSRVVKSQKSRWNFQGFAENNVVYARDYFSTSPLPVISFAFDFRYYPQTRLIRTRNFGGRESDVTGAQPALIDRFNVFARFLSGLDFPTFHDGGSNCANRRDIERLAFSVSFTFLPIECSPLYPTPTSKGIRVRDVNQGSRFAVVELSSSPGNFYRAPCARSIRNPIN